MSINRKFRPFRELSLRAALILLMIVAVMLTFSIIGGAILIYRLPQIEEMFRGQLQERAVNTSRQLNHITAGIEAQLVPLANLVLNRSAVEIPVYADAIIGSGEVFDSLFILSADGIVESLSLPSRRKQAATELRGADYSQSRLFRAVKEGPGSENDKKLIWSDKYLSALSGKNAVGVAMRAENKVIIGETSVERILAILQDSASNNISTVMIIDGNGQWLASSAATPDSQERFADFSGSKTYQAVMNGTPLPEYELTPSGRMIVGGVQSEKLKWAIIAIVPAGWNNASYRMSFLLVIAGFLGSLLIAIALAPIWAARISKPLKALIWRTHAASEGDYDAPWPQRSVVTELNQLSDDLEQMVTEIRLRETESARSEERLRATLENTPSVAVQWFDAEGRVLYWNKASEIVYGYSASEALGMRIQDNPLMFLDHDQSSAFLRAILSTAVTGNAIGPTEFPLRHKNGNPLIVLATTFAIPGDGDNPIFVCMDVDVTERANAEAALQNSEKKLEAIFNASPAPMSVSDANNDFSVITVNAAWEKQFRRGRESVIGRNGLTLGLWPDTESRNQFLHALKNGKVEGLETKLLASDGEPILCSISALVTTIGADSLMLMMAVDVTEQRRIENEIRSLNADLEQRVFERTEALSQANDELEATLVNLKATQEQLVQSEKLASLGNLVAGIAHELNTPIGNGVMAVSTMRDHLVQFRQAAESGLRRSTLTDFLSNIDGGSDIAERNLRRAAELVSSFKQVAVDQTSSQRRSFQLIEVVDEVRIILNPTLKRTPYLIDCDVPRELELDSYPGPLGQVLTNLISNSVTHGFEGRDLGTIYLGATAQANGCIAIAVRDNGNGIPAELQGRVFDPFFTTKMGRGGTGLGLHLVFGIVTNVLGGTIKLKSDPGKGTEFLLTIPRIAPSANAEPQIEHEP